MRTFLCALLICVCGWLPAQALPADCRQLVLTTTPDWGSLKAQIRCYERGANGWKQVRGPWPAVVGQSGLGWGLGLAPIPQGGTPIKKEGDGKGPAGIYELPEFFGYAANRPSGDLPFRVLSPTLWGVDDPTSRYYNQIVDSAKVEVDWDSAEKMYIDDYRLGIRVGHNMKSPRPGAGSCIFVHRWENGETGTAGCTAFEKGNLRKLCDWLRKDKHPLLVQLPSPVYLSLRKSWELP